MKSLSIILKQKLQEQTILKEYAQKIVTFLLAKFKKERPDLNDEQIKYYIERFEKVKSSPKVTEKDILKYTFTQLEQVVDSFPTENTVSKDINTAQVKGEEVYEGGGIEVYLGDDRDKCVRYRKAFQGDTKQAYSWCIARSDSSNLFTGYRYGYGTSRIFYFVIDRNKPTTDPFHAFVVHVFDNGTYGITSAHNEGDRTGLDWNGVLELVPALSHVPQNVFKPKPLTKEETDIYNITKPEVRDDDLFKHFNGNRKYVEAYISIHQHSLTDHQILTLLQQKHDDLVNTYINTGAILSSFITGKLSKQLFDNYLRIGKQIYEQTESGYRVGDERLLCLQAYGLLKLSTEEFMDNMHDISRGGGGTYLDSKSFDLFLNNLGEELTTSLVIDMYFQFTTEQCLIIYRKYPQVGLQLIQNYNRTQEYQVLPTLLPDILTKNDKSLIYDLFINGDYLAYYLDKKSYDIFLQYNRKDILFDMIAKGHVIEKEILNFFDEDLQKAYANAANHQNLDTNRVELMIKFNIKLDWLDSIAPQYRVLPELKKNYPDYKFMSMGPFVYGNGNLSVATAGPASGHEFYFVNKQGVLDTNNMNDDELWKMNDRLREDFFNQRFETDYWKAVRWHAQGVFKVVNRNNSSMFINRDNQPYMGNLTIETCGDLTSYFNTKLKEFKYLSVNKDNDGYYICKKVDGTTEKINGETLKPVTVDSLMESYIKKIFK